MQSETAGFAPGAATLQTRRNIRIVFISGLFAPLCDNMTSSTKPEVHNVLQCRPSLISTIALLLLLIIQTFYISIVKIKVGFVYSAAYTITGPARFTISEVSAADWQELMVLQRSMWPSIARANG